MNYPIRILERWYYVAILIGVLKVTVTLSAPIQGDTINWAGAASVVLQYLRIGRFPPISVTGVYGPMGFVLAPFVWVWTKLPIEHPSITQQSMLYGNPNPTSIFLLKILMQVPTFTADFATGFVVLKLVKVLTGSGVKGKGAFLIWLGNPLNIVTTNYLGSMDVIPALVFVLALLLSYEAKYFRSGLCLCIAAILRLFPFLILPCFLVACTRRTRSYSYLLSGFLIPLVFAIGVVYATGAGTLTAIAKIPQTQHWLLDFLGLQVVGQTVRLGFVLVAAQLLMAVLYWRGPNLLHLATVSILALFLGALPYGGDLNHAMWVSPLLTVSLALNAGELWIYVLTFGTGLAQAIYGGPPTDTFLWGASYAFRTTYLLKLNLEETERGPFQTLRQVENPHHFPKPLTRPVLSA